MRRWSASSTTRSTLIELGEAEGDAATVGRRPKRPLRRAAEAAEKRELETLLSGEADANDCYLEVHAGAGGTEAQDWAEMLLRMYVRWAEQHGYKVEWLEESPGEEAGLKSATIQVIGRQRLWLAEDRERRASPGAHLALRQPGAPPYQLQLGLGLSGGRRHHRDRDPGQGPAHRHLSRSSGAGGQHVNKTDSAIRITHIPTGIVVTCQADRSQHRNRATAMEMLKARLYEVELQKREAEAAEAEATKTDIGWGHQIRSYVLQPYQMVKDLRTGVETSDTQAVLDGDLDRFMAASLAARVGEGEAGKA